MKKGLKIFYCAIIFILMISGKEIYAEDKVDIVMKVELDKIQSEALVIHECFMPHDNNSYALFDFLERRSNQKISGNKFIRAIKKPYSNSKFELVALEFEVGNHNLRKSLYLSSEYYGDSELEMVKRESEELEGIYTIDEDEKYFYLRYSVKEDIEVKKINISYKIKDVMVEGNDGYYYKFDLYENSVNSLNISAIKAKVNDFQTISGNTVNKIWADSNKIGQVNQSSMNHLIEYDMRNYNNALIAVMYLKDNNNLMETKNKDFNLNEIIFSKSIGLNEIYNINYQNAKEIDDNKQQTMNNKTVVNNVSTRRGRYPNVKKAVISLGSIAMGILTIYIKRKRRAKIRSIVDEAEEKSKKRFKGRYGEPDDIRACFVAVLTEQDQTIVNMTIFLELLRSNKIKIQKIKEANADINFQNYIVKTPETNYDILEYQQAMIDKIKELNKEQTVTLDRFKQFIDFGYFNESLVECKKSYIKYIESPINMKMNFSKNDWLEFKDNIINRNSQMYNSMQINDIEKSHLLTVALGNSSVEFIESIKSETIEKSKYLKKLNVKNSEFITISKFLEVNKESEYKI